MMILKELLFLYLYFCNPLLKVLFQDFMKENSSYSNFALALFDTCPLEKCNTNNLYKQVECPQSDRWPLGLVVSEIH